MAFRNEYPPKLTNCSNTFSAMGPGTCSSCAPRRKRSLNGRTAASPCLLLSASELVPLARCESGEILCHLEHLLLEDDHAQRFLQCRFEPRVEITHGLHPLPAPQIGAHHVSSQWPGTDERDLDGQITTRS